MMRIKKICIFICMFVVLLFIVLAPILFYRFNDERILNKLYIEDVEHENRPIEKSNLKLEEKIDFLSKYKSDSHIVSSSHRESLNEENKAMLNRNLLREMKSLQSLNSIPNIDIQSSVEYTGYETVIFSDVSSPEKHVSLWHIQLLCQDYYMEVWMDSETKKIYQFMIEGNISFSIDIEVFCEKYLGLDVSYVKKFYVVEVETSQIAIFIRPLTIM